MPGRGRGRGRGNASKASQRRRAAATPSFAHSDDTVDSDTDLHRSPVPRQSRRPTQPAEIDDNNEGDGEVLNGEAVDEEMQEGEDDVQVMPNSTRKASTTGKRARAAAGQVNPAPSLFSFSQSPTPHQTPRGSASSAVATPSTSSESMHNLALKTFLEIHFRRDTPFTPQQPGNITTLPPDLINHLPGMDGLFYQLHVVDHALAGRRQGGGEGDSRRAEGGFRALSYAFALQPIKTTPARLTAPPSGEVVVGSSTWSDDQLEEAAQKVRTEAAASFGGWQADAVKRKTAFMSAWEDKSGARGSTQTGSAPPDITGIEADLVDTNSTSSQLMETLLLLADERSYNLILIDERLTVNLDVSGSEVVQGGATGRRNSKPTVGLHQTERSHSSLLIMVVRPPSSRSDASTSPLRYPSPPRTPNTVVLHRLRLRITMDIPNAPAISTVSNTYSILLDPNARALFAPESDAITLLLSSLKNRFSVFITWPLLQEREKMRQDAQRARDIADDARRQSAQKKHKADGGAGTDDASGLTTKGKAKGVCNHFFYCAGEEPAARDKCKAVVSDRQHHDRGLHLNCPLDLWTESCPTFKRRSQAQKESFKACIMNHDKWTPKPPQNCNTLTPFRECIVPILSANDSMTTQATVRRSMKRWMLQRAKMLAEGDAVCDEQPVTDDMNPFLTQPLPTSMSPYYSTPPHAPPNPMPFPYPGPPHPGQAHYSPYPSYPASQYAPWYAQQQVPQQHGWHGQQQPQQQPQQHGWYPASPTSSDIMDDELPAERDNQRPETSHSTHRSPSPPPARRPTVTDTETTAPAASSSPSTPTSLLTSGLVVVLPSSPYWNNAPHDTAPILYHSSVTKAFRDPSRTIILFRPNQMDRQDFAPAHLRYTSPDVLFPSHTHPDFVYQRRTPLTLLHPTPLPKTTELLGPERIEMATPTIRTLAQRESAFRKALNSHTFDFRRSEIPIPYRKDNIDSFWPLYIPPPPAAAASDPAAASLPTSATTSAAPSAAPSPSTTTPATTSATTSASTLITVPTMTDVELADYIAEQEPRRRQQRAAAVARRAVEYDVRCDEETEAEFCTHIDKLITLFDSDPHLHIRDITATTELESADESYRGQPHPRPTVMELVDGEQQKRSVGLTLTHQVNQQRWKRVAAWHIASPYNLARIPYHPRSLTSLLPDFGIQFIGANTPMLYAKGDEQGGDFAFHAEQGFLPFVNVCHTGTCLWWAVRPEHADKLAVYVSDLFNKVTRPSTPIDLTRLPLFCQLAILRSRCVMPDPDEISAPPYNIPVERFEQEAGDIMIGRGFIFHMGTAGSATVVNEAINAAPVWWLKSGLPELVSLLKTELGPYLVTRADSFRRRLPEGVELTDELIKLLFGNEVYHGMCRLFPINWFLPFARVVLAHINVALSVNDSQRLDSDHGQQAGIKFEDFNKEELLKAAEQLGTVVGWCDEPAGKLLAEYYDAQHEAERTRSAPATSQRRRSRQQKRAVSSSSKV